MAMTAEEARWTLDMVRALPDDGNRYEVLDGVLLVTPIPTLLHQRAIGDLMIPLDRYARTHKVGETMFSPSDIELSPTRLVQPDLFVIPAELKVTDWKDVTRLLLVVEVLSSSTARADRVLKRRAYQEAGIPEYWIFDLDSCLVERWRPSDDRPEVLNEVLEWQPMPGVDPLRIELDQVFDLVTDEDSQKVR